MTVFEQVTEDEFDAAIASSPSSQTFKERYARYSATRDDHCFVHHGSLTLQGHFAVPGYCTLIIGDLTVDGFIDLNNPDDFDEGGLFIVIGDVSCSAFSGHYGKCSFVDGDLIARDVIINAYGDSALMVMGDLKTKLFYGEEIWGEVGGVADFEYAYGHCLPIGYRNAAAQRIGPRRETPAHLVLAPDLLHDDDDVNNDVRPLDVHEACSRLRRGESILRSEREVD